MKRWKWASIASTAFAVGMGLLGVMDIVGLNVVCAAPPPTGGYSSGIPTYLCLGGYLPAGTSSLGLALGAAIPSMTVLTIAAGAAIVALAFLAVHRSRER